MRKFFLFLLPVYLLLVGQTAWASDVYEKITDVSGLVAGDQYLIVNTAGTFAAGATSSTSTKYATTVSVTVSNSKITDPNSNVAVYTLGGNSKDGWTFYSSKDLKYLYWGSGNSLNVNASVSTNSSWGVTFSAGEATISNKNTTAREIRFNSDRFACYTTGAGTSVCLYKKQVPKNPNSITVTGGTTKSIALTGPSAIESGMYDLSEYVSSTYGTVAYSIKSTTNLTEGEENDFEMAEGLFEFHTAYKGIIVVTASVAEGDTYQAASQDITINCSGNLRSPAYSFTDGYELATGASVTVENGVNITTDGVITLSTTDVSVASVDNVNKKITGVAVGTCSITIATAEGTYYNEGSKTFAINVIAAKGSAENPYTVAEIIDGTATGSNIYVKGFIVGEYVGKTTTPKTSGFTTDANIAIADPFTSTPTASGSVPVALPTDALKSAWGCQTTGGALLGYEVLIKGNKDTYFSVNGIKSTTEVNAVSVPISTKSGRNYGTCVTNYRFDFASADNISAYIATGLNGDYVQLTSVDIVPSGTPIIVKTDSKGASINVPVTSESADDVSSNALVAGDGTTAWNGTAGYIYYYLASDQFHYANEGTLQSGKAYLKVAGSATAPSIIRIADEENNATNIEAIEAVEEGVKYIQNGQLFIKKNGVVYDAMGHAIR